MRLRDFRSIALVVALLAALPLAVPLLVGTGLAVGANLLVNLLVFALIITLAAQGWNIAGGYGGQFSFGHAAFFGTGAYAQAILQTRFGVNPWAALPLAVAAGGLAGAAIGYLAFRARLRGSYFALVTLAFAEVFRILANAAPITGGAAGILVPLDVRIGNFQFAAREAFFYLALALVGLVLVINRAVELSRFGAYLVAVRENEDAARALGVDTLRVKLKAITLSAAITAVAGALYTQKFLYIDANIAYGSWISVEALLAPIIGGIGTLFGPLFGTLTLLGLGELAKIGIHALFGAAVPGVDLVVYGVLLILAIAFAPQGVMGLASRLVPRGGR
ncbi:branched-chain amino acid ABC transporter permease [Phreatobacter stygius]|uniref:Branched-chain amino acid ABC transporter permease n=1 Tax=Phreatobacter stygius TaxID=1940610 RepID=A0A4D7B1V8_9HYPH|nr:branched-chain amino acid ABC transporter permease [Phreatobacter stygius]QCI67709.1 branched-chain amino acid ABC transporter permease [Phreatobacter stygius]